MANRPLALSILVVGIAAFQLRAFITFAWSVWRNYRCRPSAFELVARGLSNVINGMGPWTLSDLMLGVAALAKITERDPPPFPGRILDDLAHDSCFLAEAQHWRSIAEAAYADSAVQWSLQTGLPESTLLSANWSSKATLCPAFVVAIDAAFGAVVLAIRGTKDVVDVLVDVAGAPHNFLGSWCHGGFVYGANLVLEEVRPYLIKALKDFPSFEIVCIGHSLGAGVATLLAFLLREEQLNARCWAFSPPACVDENLASVCSPFTTSIIAFHDIVPRFSAASVERLREEICAFDWEKVAKLAKEDDSWRMLANAASSMKRLQKLYHDASMQIEQLDRNLNLGCRVDSPRQVVHQALKTEPGLWGDETSQKAFGLSQLLENGSFSDKTRQFSSNLNMSSMKPNPALHQCSKNSNRFQSANSCKENLEGHTEGMKSLAELCSMNKECVNPVALFPPGKLLVLSCLPSGCGVAPMIRLTAPYIRSYGVFPSYDQGREVQWILSEAKIDDFRRIVVSPWCLSDHMLSTIGVGLDSLQRHATPLMSVLKWKTISQ